MILVDVDTRRMALESDRLFKVAMVRAYPRLVERIVRSRGYVTDAERRQEAAEARGRQDYAVRRKDVLERFAQHRTRLRIRRMSWRLVIEQEAEKAGFTVADLLGRDRGRKVSLARHMAMYRMREELRSTLPTIADRFKRDHSTVVYAVNKVRKMLVELEAVERVR